MPDNKSIVQVFRIGKLGDTLTFCGEEATKNCTQLVDGMHHALSELIMSLFFTPHNFCASCGRYAVHGQADYGWLLAQR